MIGFMSVHYNSNGCRAGSGCAYLVPVYGCLEWPSSGMVGFYYHEPSRCGGPGLCSVLGCDQLMTGPTHARGGTLDLLMTYVPDLVRVAVVAPLGSSDHSSHSAAISMAQFIPNFCVSSKALLKHRVNWTTVCDAICGLSWRSIWSADNPVERLNVQLSLLAERFVPTKMIRVCN